jgi:hypothetical protein
VFCPSTGNKTNMDWTLWKKKTLSKPKSFHISVFFFRYFVKITKNNLHRRQCILYMCVPHSISCLFFFKYLEKKSYSALGIFSKYCSVIQHLRICNIVLKLLSCSKNMLVTC